MRDVASEAKGILEPLRDHPSTHLSLRQTFRQLRHATDAALDNLAAQGGLRAETIALFRRYRERIRDYYDDEDLAEAAAAAVRNDNAPGLKDLGFIVFFRVRGLTPAQRTLAHALAENERCAMLLGETGDEQADQSTHALSGDLRPVLSEPQPPADAQANAPTKSSHILIAPDAHQELRWVIRRIMQRAQSGTPFHRMAVLYRKEAPYGTLIREELTLANIPVAGPNPASLADTAVGSTLLGLLSLRDADFARDAVMAWLTGCPLKPPPGIDAASFNPTLWDTVSKRANVVRGTVQWEQRLSQYADNLDREAADRQGELSEARAERMRSDAAVARQLLHFVTDLIQNASPPVDHSWSGYSDWAKELLGSYLADNLPAVRAAHVRQN